MAFHAAQTFTYGEQPSAAKWQYIWDNDYALADGTGISNDVILARHMANDSVETAAIKDANVTPAKLSNPYKFMGGKTSVQTLSDAAWTDITFAEQYDTNNNYDGTTYTIPVNGYYHFAYSLSLQVDSQAGTYFAGQFVTDDSKNYGYQSHSTSSYPHWDAGVSSSCTLYMTTGKTIKVQAYIDVGSGSGSVHGGANQTSVFSGFYVCP